jgi:hypothetical protein
MVDKGARTTLSLRFSNGTSVCAGSLLCPTDWQPCFTVEGSVEAAVTVILEYFATPKSMA